MIKEIEKKYTKKQTVKILERLIESLGKDKAFKMQIKGKKVYVSNSREIEIEYEKDKNEEKIEIEIKWENRMKKVVFICHGNMFRSQVAKGLYNKIQKDGSIAYSFGTNVLDRGLQGLKLSQRPGLEILIFELKKYGIDISNEYCNQLKEEYLKNVDKIIVMAEKEYIPEWLKKYNYEYWEVPNPEVHVTEEISDIIKLIKEKVIKLMS